MFLYDFLGQFRFRALPSLTVHPWRVEAEFWYYLLRGGYWSPLAAQTRTFAASSTAASYFDALCARGRAIGPTSGGRNFPVRVRLIRSGSVVRECSA